MSNFINIALLIFVCAGVIFLLKKRFSNANSKRKPVVDPEAQNLYNLEKQEQIPEKNLTLEEKIELSWQFLVNIKDKILNKFSKPDLETLRMSGEVLVKNGARYQHDIDGEVNIIQNISKVQSVSKTKKEEVESISR